MTLFEAVSITLRRLHYSPRTEESYLRWVREFVRFHHRRHPRETGFPEVNSFLNGLAVRRCRPANLPTVLSRRDVLALLERLQAPFRLLGELLSGSGLRLPEALSLRINDVDIERHQITVRRGNGSHDRAALLPARARDGLTAQIEALRRLHQAQLVVDRGPLGVVSPLDH